MLNPIFSFQIFDGNGINFPYGILDDIKYNDLPRPITARYIRIRPIKKQNDGFPISLRAELYGCGVGKVFSNSEPL